MRRKPTHPGRLLKNILDRKEITVKDFAENSGLPEYLLQELIEERWSIGAPMAEFLAYHLDMSPEAWLNAQRNYDKWVEENDNV